MDSEVMKQDISILDGGFATELERKGFSFMNDPLWSARALYTDPEAVVGVHKSYLEHGADIITTASYQASIPGFRTHLGTTEEGSKNLIKLSVDLAKRARNEYINESKNGNRNIMIAGSVGPYGAALADGSEYAGNYCDNISQQELIEWHRPRVQCLLEAGADVLAFETIPAVREAEALLTLLREYPDAKAWLSFSSQSPHKTSHGDDIDTAARNCLKIAPINQLIAIGVNCCPPEYATSLLTDISKTVEGFPLIVYPNSGEMWDSVTGWSGQKTVTNHKYLETWIIASAKIIGGCCRTTPEDIELIYRYVHKK